MKKLIISTAVLVSALFITTTSCEKHTDVKATIIVKDSLNNAAGGALVKLYAKVMKSGTTYTADIKAEGTTDNDGMVSFVFKLPAIFDVKVFKGKMTGVGIIKLDEPGKSAEKTISIR